MRLFALLLTLVSSLALGTELTTPSQVPLNPAVSTVGCSAFEATTAAYKTTVTGFSADGNYVLGQVQSHFTCGHSGRGSTVHTVYTCTYLTWDLSGLLVSTNTPSAGGACPAVSLEAPPMAPPGGTVVGNEFTNSGGFTAETVLTEACGSIACYATYYYPVLLLP